MSNYMKAFVLSFIIACTSVTWKTYTDNINHFSMKYPDKWIQKTASSSVGFLSPREGDKDMFQENVGLMLQDLTQQPMNLEGYTELTKKQIVANLGESAILSLKNVTLAGQQSKEFIYDMNYQGKNLKIKQYWFIKGNIAYLFTYTAEPSQFEKHESTATEMIKSFKFF